MNIDKVSEQSALSQAVSGDETPNTNQRAIMGEMQQPTIVTNNLPYLGRYDVQHTLWHRATSHFRYRLLENEDKS